MGNCRSTSRVLPSKTYVPDLEWKIHDFSSLLETGAKTATSGRFHCSDYEWYLNVSPMHEKPGAGTPYVALWLMLSREKLKRDHTVHAVFELSIYNQSKGMYCGCQANYNFDFKNNYSKECLIPLKELLKSSAFLVDDSCVFGVEILKIDVSSPEKKAVVVHQKTTTVQNLFVQNKGFIEGTYIWSMDNFPELESKHFVRSPTFEVGGHKWYTGMYPRGDKFTTDSLSLYLYLDASKKLPALESKKVAVMTLSILDQKNGKHLTRTAGLWVCANGWGWADFLGLEKLKDPSGGYVVGSNCVIKADLTLVGSSTEGQI
uniref:Uncharacterized protein n=1 Tax=Avena sativa TaxID=4498 RepID=A0ACD5TN57_AVESA